MIGLLLIVGLGFVSPSSAWAQAGSDTLLGQEVLGPGEHLTSGDGRSTLWMQTDGNVVLYVPGGAAWTTRTSVPGTRLVMQADGNLVAYTPSNAPVWFSRTGGQGARLLLQDDGNAVLYDGANRPLWATGTNAGPAAPAPVPAPAPADQLIGGTRLLPGERLGTSDGRHVLAMQSDGNLVLYGPAGAVWSSRTGTPGTSALMQDDGNLVAYTPAGVPAWQTRTGGNPGARVVLQGDGNLVLYRADGLPAWYPASPVPAGIDIGPAIQVIAASASTPSATYGTLTAYALGPGGWLTVLPTRTAWFGSAGVGPAREGLARTPIGTYPVPSAFGRAPDPGTALPYRTIDTRDWWVSDSNSPSYNQPARCAAGTCPFDENAGENLWAQGAVYQYAAVIDFNPTRLPGAGSAVFLHVANGRPTAGCVAVDQAGMVALLRWLSPSARPVIGITTG